MIVSFFYVVIIRKFKVKSDYQILYVIVMGSQDRVRQHSILHLKIFDIMFINKKLNFDLRFEST